MANATGAKVVAPQHNVTVLTDSHYGVPRVRDVERSAKVGFRSYGLPGEFFNKFKPK